MSFFILFFALQFSLPMASLSATSAPFVSGIDGAFISIDGERVIQDAKDQKAENAFLTYRKGQIFLKTGRMVNGKRVRVFENSVQMDLPVDGKTVTYPFSEIKMVKVKAKLPKKLGFVSVGFAVAELSFEPAYNVQPRFIPLILTLSFLRGYVLGLLIEEWDVIYFAPIECEIPSK
jgi:hypothetical protein